MNARGREAWNALRASYWFVPILLALAAGALAFVTLAIDGATARQTAGRESGVRRQRRTRCCRMISVVLGRTPPLRSNT